MISPQASASGGSARRRRHLDIDTPFCPPHPDQLAIRVHRPDRRACPRSACSGHQTRLVCSRKPGVRSTGSGQRWRADALGHGICRISFLVRCDQTGPRGASNSHGRSCSTRARSERERLTMAAPDDLRGDRESLDEPPAMAIAGCHVVLVGVMRPGSSVVVVMRALPQLVTSVLASRRVRQGPTPPRPSERETPAIEDPSSASSTSGPAWPARRSCCSLDEPTTGLDPGSATRCGTPCAR